MSTFVTVEEQTCSMENLLSANNTTGETSPCIVNSSKGNNENVSETFCNEETLIEVEQSLIHICKKSPIKELEIKLENIMHTSIEEQKKHANNKENQTINIIKDTLVEKNVRPIVLSIPKPPTSMNKSLTEKEIKSAKNELNLGKHRHSRELTESAVEHSAQSIEMIDTSEEKINTFTDLSISHNEKDLKKVDSSIDGASKRQSLVHNIDSESTTNANETALSHDHVELIETTNLRDETSVENANKSNTNLTAKTRKSGTINETLSNDDEIKSDEQIEYQDQDELLNNSTEVAIGSHHSNCHSNSLIDVEGLSLETGDEETAIDKSVTRTDTDLIDVIEQPRNDSSKSVTKSTARSSFVLETVNSVPSDSNMDNAMTQNTQFSDVIEASQNATVDTEKVKSKDVSVTREKSENMQSLETEEKNQEDLEDIEIEDSNLDTNILGLFQDIPAKSKKKMVKNNDNESSVHSNIRSIEKQPDGYESEYDLILVDKQAWLAAENMKTKKYEDDTSNFDSDDSMVLKSQLDAIKAKNDAKPLQTIEEIVSTDADNEEEEEEVKRLKARKSSSKRVSLKENKDFSTEFVEADSFTDKATNKSKTALNQSGNLSVSGLNKSQQIAKATRRSSKIHDKSNEEIEDDADKLNKSSQASKKNTSLRKSTEERKSLIKSSKDTPSKQKDQSVRDRTQANDSEKEFNTDSCIEKIRKKKRSSDKLSMHNEYTNDNVIEAENTDSQNSDKIDVFINRLVDNKSKLADTKSTQMDEDDSDENDESEQVIYPMHFDSTVPLKKNIRNYSTIVHTGSTSDELNSNEDVKNKSSTNSFVPSVDFRKDEIYQRSLKYESPIDSNEDSSSDVSINSDVKKEYNLTGAKQKVADDGIPGDECRDSESEASDSDDNGSDLRDFVVDDDDWDPEDFMVDGDEIEDEEREEKEEENSDKEEGEELNLEEDQAAEEKIIEEMEECKQNDKDQSAEKRKVRGKDDILSDDYFIIMSSAEKRRKSKTQDSFKDVTREDSKKVVSMELSNETPKTVKVTEKELQTIKCSTPNSSKKISEIKTPKMTPASILTRFKLSVSPHSMAKITNKGNKSMNITHTETPTIRHLRKEKLSESVPSLSSNREFCSSKEEISDSKEAMKMKAKDCEEQISSLVMSDKFDQQKQKKCKKQKTEKVSNEDIIDKIIDNAAFCGVVESKVSKKKKKKRDELSLAPIAENTGSKDTREKRKKKKKKKEQIGEKNDNINEDDMLQEDIRKNKTKNKLIAENIGGEDTCQKKKRKGQIGKKNQNINEDMLQEDIRDKTKSLQHSKRKKEKLESSLEYDTITTDDYAIIKKKAKRQKVGETKEASKLLEKKKKETSVTRTKVPKSVSDKNIKTNKKLRSQNIAPITDDKFENVAFIKARAEVVNEIKRITDRLNVMQEPSEERKKQGENVKIKIRKQDTKIATKEKKKEKDVRKQVLPTFTGGLKRLSDDVIENLSDVPMRAKKRRRISRNEEQVKPSTSSSCSVTKSSSVYHVTPSSCGSTTQFTVVNLQKVDKLTTTQTDSSMTTFRQRMLARIDRRPVSSYLKYYEKRHATSKDGFSNNPF